MEPSGAPQPPRDAAYQVLGNPVTSNPLEERARHHQDHGRPVASRVPGNQSSGIKDAIPSSLGWGIHGAPAGEEQFGRTMEDVGRHRELEGDQMRTPGEGRVADAVDRKSGASGAEPDLASDLDRKKREQAEARSYIKGERRYERVSDGGAQVG
ncbi:hypothetical protein F4859DRAFT_486753 [Xylaria cf. heliscus]|nr:hypothetical protein F4859DRAFT_486753 [Xylaria cf. heliscus]